MTTAVRTGEQGHGGLSLLVIEAGMDGFAVSKPLRKMGWLCCDTAELAFTNVPVPRENLVGDLNSGFGQIAQQFQGERLSLAFQASATAQRCLDLALECVTHRETFGRSLSSRQVIRHRLADLARERGRAPLPGCTGAGNRRRDDRDHERDHQQADRPLTAAEVRAGLPQQRGPHSQGSRQAGMESLSPLGVSVFPLGS